MWPGGDRKRARLLGEAEIANVGGTAEVGDYDYRVFTTDGAPTVGRAPRFDRRLGAWRLLAYVLDKAREIGGLEWRR